MKNIYLLSVFFLLSTFFIIKSVDAAQICYPQREINQHRCVTSGFGGGCSQYRSEYIGTGCHREGATAEDAETLCEVQCQQSGLYPGGTYCAQAYCVSYAPGGVQSCEVQERQVGCTAAPQCSAIADIISCFQVDATTCNETLTGLIYECWGPGPDPSPSGGGPVPTPAPTPNQCGNGACSLFEDCNTCPADCGSCPIVPGPTPPISCGNLICDGGETCTTCPGDCGACPTGNIRARAVLVPADQATCVNINASTSYLNLTSLGFSSPVGIPRQAQILDQYVIWNSLTTGTYTLDAIPPSPPPNYVFQRACWSSTNGTSGQTATSTLTTNATVTYNVGISLQPDWMQVVGGSVNAGAGAISVVVPNTETLVKKEPGVTQNSPVVSYGTTINTGGGAVSTDGYVVQDTNQTIPAGFSYYDYYDNTFGNKVTLSSGTADPVPLAGTVGVYVRPGTGNLTVTGTWNVVSGQYVVIFIPGNLTISTNITVAEGGFLAFIVNGDISVTDTVGHTTPLANPDKVTQANVTGIYITDGQFITQPTVGVADRQLVVAGTVVANTITLNRDLETNNNYPGEVFIYRPDLWSVAPQELKEIDVTWKEIAP